jgi:thioesterase domain-containing protein
LFLIHDAYGESLLYLDLARCMPDAIAVYGLEPAGRGRVPVIHSSIAEFGAHYAREIRRRQPHGPYCIGGLCAGGVLAFEVARQLRQAGERVALLVLLEAGTPQAPKRRSAITWRAGRMLEALRRDARPTLSALRTICKKVRGFGQFLYGRLKTRAAGRRQIELLRRFRDGSPWPEHEPVPTMNDVWNAIERSYHPESIPDQPAVLYRASVGEGSDLPYRDFLADPLFGWGRVLGTGLVAVDVPGGHFSSLRVPQVEVLAVDLRRRLAHITAQPALGTSHKMALPAPGTGSA